MTTRLTIPQRRRRPGASGVTDTALGLSGRRGPVSVVLRVVLYVAIAFVFAGPLLAVLVGAFSELSDPAELSLIPDSFTLNNFAVAADRGVLGYLLNSFLVVGFGLLLQISVSVLAAYALARKKFRGMTAVLLLILATMMLPEEILAIPLSVVLSDLPVFGTNLIGSLAGMILPVGAWGFSILVMTEFMREVPIELEEAARIDGAGELRIFWSVVLPLCRPAVGVIGVFGFTMVWDQYLLPLIVATEPGQYTLPIALRILRSDEQVGSGVLLASALLALLPSVIAFLAMQRQFMRGLTAGAVKG
ncbi:carbohydrate ABC transporter permease [Amycolatopsis suaedae]|uniref:Carbohydrate ABC transporter permease n=1 Tax=Amycolatopsis suaedae TaxID=2510978 RepID=A0A4Q7J803_9PSEU|nr:carbohydrate ABC transporter permease [Amycolatopsis suaedae]RZQ63810.1 carbohydrate ABC transporter permease [Amycolatopsis suaedae]